MTPLELAWFADERGLNARTATQKLQHYHYRWVPKAAGGYRLLEAPKPRLRQIQRWLLHHVLAGIPASSFAHGFVGGRSVRSFVEPHVGQDVVIRFDLQAFFASVTRARVAASFRRVGYPAAMASTLSGLCTAATPVSVLAAHPREEISRSDSRPTRACAIATCPRARPRRRRSATWPPFASTAVWPRWPRPTARS